jgi:hypothetical protein
MSGGQRALLDWFQGVLVMVAVGIYTQARTRAGHLTQVAT